MSALSHKPESSHIERIACNPAEKSISVTFKGGKTYTYSVPEKTEEIYRAFIGFPSAGEYFHRFLKRFPLLRKTENSAKVTR